MKKGVLLISFVFTFFVGLSQLSHVELLIGFKETEVSQYLDSLNHLQSNPYYKVERDISPDGDLLLKSSFSINDQSFYKCSAIFVWFARLKGSEYCIRQVIMGDTKYAQDNMTFVKDNFKKNPNGQWERPFDSNALTNSLKILASFEKTDDEYPTFKITYELSR